MKPNMNTDKPHPTKWRVYHLDTMSGKRMWIAAPSARDRKEFATSRTSFKRHSAAVAYAHAWAEYNDERRERRKGKS